MARHGQNIPEGEVKVEITCQDEGHPGREVLRLCVRDNGPGLDAEQRKRIFEPFYSTRARGSGLGMAIAARILEAHGGSIAVGEGGPGTAIILYLPRS